MIAVSMNTPNHVPCDDPSAKVTIFAFALMSTPVEKNSKAPRLKCEKILIGNCGNLAPRSLTGRSTIKLCSKATMDTKLIYPTSVLSIRHKTTRGTGY